jgi:hypothetical protein
MVCVEESEDLVDVTLFTFEDILFSVLVRFRLASAKVGLDEESSPETEADDDDVLWREFDELESNEDEAVDDLLELELEW